jgi:YVTN family beta-propeller protein
MTRWSRPACEEARTRGGSLVSPPRWRRHEVTADRTAEVRAGEQPAGGGRARPVLVVLIVLAVIGLGAWLVTAAVTSDADEASVATPDDAATTDGPGPDDDADAATTEAADTEVEETEPAPETEPEPVVVTHRFDLVTEPAGAAVTVTTADGEVLRGDTPFREELVAGTADVEVTADGYQTITDLVEVDRDLDVSWELGPPGLLHRKVGTFEVGSQPKQVAYTPDGSQVWVTLLGARGVEVYDANSFERLADVTLGTQGGAVEIIFTPDGDTAYASQMESASVFEIDTASYEVLRQLPTGGTWSKVMALAPDGSSLYVANWVSNDVSEIDLASGEVVRRLPTVQTPRGLYAAEDGERLFVAGYGNGDLARIDLATGSTEVLFSTGRAMRHLVGDGERLYASDMGTNQVYVLDLATEEVAELAATDINPNTIDLSPDGRVLYVSNRGANNPETYYLPGPEWGSVLAIDTATGEPLDAIVGGNQTTGLDVAPDGRTVVFSDFLDNRVQVYEIPSHAVLTAGGGGRYGAHRDDLAK